jgi:hypothetical protein
MYESSKKILFNIEVYGEFFSGITPSTDTFSEHYA